MSVAALAATLGSLLVSLPAQAAPDAAPPPAPWSMPSEIPSATTPGISSGTKVLSFAEVGDKVYAAGTYTEVGGSPRSGIAAFDRRTGALDPTFAPTVLGNVYAVTPGPTPDTIYIGGAFRSVNGVSLGKVALLDATTGAPIAGFKPPKFNEAVQDLKLRGGNLYLGGDFTLAGTVPRGGLASLHPTTGALTNALTVALTEHHNTDPTRAQKPIGAASIDITKDGSRMVVGGNFRKADGLDRDQVVQIDLTGTSSSVRADWQTNRFKPLCFNWAVDSYVRGVSLSPDGSYFVVGANGGPNPGTLCDTATKWRTADSGADRQPEWISPSGGDTIWGVAASEHAIYIGGHMRWMNNPLGRDSARSAAVPRPGLAVLDPLSGVPMAWNPGRKPRGTAVFGLLVARDGVWIGSDTDYLGDREYYRPKLAFFPYAGGYRATPTTTPTLPATAYVGRGLAGSTTALSSWSFDGTTAGAELSGSSVIDWSTVRGAFTVGDKLYYGTPGMLRVAPFNGSTIGTPRDVNPYHDPKWKDVPNGSGGTYDGVTPDFYAQLSGVTGMFYSGGRLYYANGQSTLKSLWFSPDSGIVDGLSATVSSSMSFADVGGMFVAGSTLYYVQRSTGNLWAIGWTGTTTTGTARLVSGPTTGGPNWAGRALFLGNAPANQPPTAAFTSRCTGLTCTLDASSSSDPDGSVAGYAWTLGDGSTATGAIVEHTYAAGGPVSVTLTVTDAAGATGTTTKTVTPVDTPSGTGFVARSATTDAFEQVKSLPMPPETAPGDTVLLTWVGESGSVPAAPAGWTQVRSVATGNSLVSLVWTKQATSVDLATTVVLTQPVSRRTVAQLLVYRGFTAVAASASATDSGATTHTTPAQPVQSGDLVVSFFADRSSATSAWTAGAGQQARGSVVGTTTTRFSTFVTDSGTREAGGTHPGATATTDATSTRGLAVGVVLRP